MDLERVGVWSRDLRFSELEEATAAAVELEGLGYGTLWVPGGAGGPVLERVGALLGAPERVVFATGILNVWEHDPAEVRATVHDLVERHPRRFLLGLGISHPSMIDKSEPGRYRKPLSKMASYLDSLDESPDPVPPSGRMLAALGPRMLELARDRTVGHHPYFVPVEHTAAARAILGDGPLLAPELAVTLQPDRAADLAAAREHMKLYFTLPNYANNLLRHGFTEDDFRAGGSERIADAIVAGGGVEGVA